jgi:hypothetical protein
VKNRFLYHFAQLFGYSDIKEGFGDLQAVHKGATGTVSSFKSQVSSFTEPET